MLLLDPSEGIGAPKRGAVQERRAMWREIRPSATGWRLVSRYSGFSGARTPRCSTCVTRSSRKTAKCIGWAASHQLLHRQGGFSLLVVAAIRQDSRDLVDRGTSCHVCGYGWGRKGFCVDFYVAAR